MEKRDILLDILKQEPTTFKRQTPKENLDNISYSDYLDKCVKNITGIQWRNLWLMIKKCFAK